MTQSNGESKNLAVVAEEIYTDHGMGADAVSKLITMINRSSDLKKEAIQFAAEEALRLAQHFIRHQVEHQSKYRDADQSQPHVYSDDLRRKVQTACRVWFDWPLMNGIKLGDATKADLEKDAGRYHANAVGNLKKERFERLIAAGLQGEQKVREVYSNDQLSRLMKKAAREKRGGADSKKQAS